MSCYPTIFYSEPAEVILEGIFFLEGMKRVRSTREMGKILEGIKESVKEGRKEEIERGKFYVAGGDGDKWEVIFGVVEIEGVRYYYLGGVIEKGENYQEAIEKIVEKLKPIGKIYREVVNQNSIEPLKRWSWKSYPVTLLEDREKWIEIQRDRRANLALSAEQQEFLRTHLFQLNPPEYPIFLTGRAGSGKSTLLHYLFAYYYLHFKKEGKECPPLYLTYNPKLRQEGVERVLQLLKLDPSFSAEVAWEEGEVEELMGSLDGEGSLLIEMLKGSSSPLVGWRKATQREIFKVLNGFRNSRTLSNVPVETIWFVIRSFIKGRAEIGENGEINYFTFEKYRELREGGELKLVEDSLFKEIDAHFKSYQEYLRRNKLYDDLDLVLEVLRLRGYEKYQHRYSYLLCDEAQDFTEVEFQLLLKLVDFKKFSFPKHLPIIFAGDQFQTLTPTGFRFPFLRRTLYQAYHRISSPGQEIPLLKLKHLTYNFRSASNLVKFNNGIQLGRRGIFGDGGEREYLQQVWREDLKGRVLGVQLERRELVETYLGREKELRVILLPDKPEILGNFLENDPLFGERGSLKELLQERITEEKGFVENPLSFKGREREIVVLYRFGDYYLELVEKEGWSSLDEVPPNFVEQLRYLYFYNKFYVATSRGRLKIVVVDSEKGWEKFWKKIAEIGGWEREEIRELVYFPVIVERLEELEETSFERGRGAEETIVDYLNSFLEERREHYLEEARRLIGVYLKDRKELESYLKLVEVLEGVREGGVEKGRIGELKESGIFEVIEEEVFLQFLGEEVLKWVKRVVKEGESDRLKDIGEFIEDILENFKISEEEYFWKLLVKIKEGHWKEILQLLREEGEKLLESPEGEEIYEFLEKEGKKNLTPEESFELWEKKILTFEEVEEWLQEWGRGRPRQEVWRVIASQKFKWKEKFKQSPRVLDCFCKYVPRYWDNPDNCFCILRIEPDRLFRTLETLQKSINSQENSEVIERFVIGKGEKRERILKLMGAKWTLSHLDSLQRKGSLNSNREVEIFLAKEGGRSYKLGAKVREKLKKGERGEPLWLFLKEGGEVDWELIEKGLEFQWSNQKGKEELFFQALLQYRGSSPEEFLSLLKKMRGECSFKTLSKIREVLEKRGWTVGKELSFSKEKVGKELREIGEMLGWKIAPSSFRKLLKKRGKIKGEREKWRKKVEEVFEEIEKVEKEGQRKGRIEEMKRKILDGEFLQEKWREEVGEKVVERVRKKIFKKGKRRNKGKEEREIPDWDGKIEVIEEKMRGEVIEYSAFSGSTELVLWGIWRRVADYWEQLEEVKREVEELEPIYSFLKREIGRIEKEFQRNRKNGEPEEYGKLEEVKRFVDENLAKLEKMAKLEEFDKGQEKGGEVKLGVAPEKIGLYRKELDKLTTAFKTLARELNPENRSIPIGRVILEMEGIATQLERKG